MNKIIDIKIVLKVFGFMIILVILLQIMFYIAFLIEKLLLSLNLNEWLSGFLSILIMILAIIIIAWFYAKQERKESINKRKKLEKMSKQELIKYLLKNTKRKYRDKSKEEIIDKIMGRFRITFS